MLLGEPLMRRLAVRTDADDLGPRLFEDEIAVAERARLDRAALSVVLGVEIQHDGAFSEQLAQSDSAPRLIGQREVRGGATGLETPRAGY